MKHIEIGRSWKKDRYRIRIGNIDGCTESMNITKEEVMNEIRDAIDKLDEELKK